MELKFAKEKKRQAERKNKMLNYNLQRHGSTTKAIVTLRNATENERRSGKVDMTRSVLSLSDGFYKASPGIRIIRHHHFKLI